MPHARTFRNYMRTPPPVIAVVGQTASGKSDIAIQIAQRWNGEIISADSRQVYRGLDIGSGKVTRAQRRLVPHALLDVASPKRTYTVARFVRDARRAVRAAHARKRLPIVVGGTGFWIDAFLLGKSIPSVPPNPRLRRALARKTPAQLYAQLRRLDPRRAKTIDQHNPVRLIRALEILHATRNPVPRREQHPPYTVCWIGIRLPRAVLERNIAKRLRTRLRTGMVAEVRELLRAGVPARRLLALGLEYRFVTQYVQGQITRAELQNQLACAIRQYAKRQATWFARNSRITWVRTATDAQRVVRAFLTSRATG